MHTYARTHTRTCTHTDTHLHIHTRAHTHGGIKCHDRMVLDCRCESSYRSNSLCLRFDVWARAVDKKDYAMF